MYYVELNVRHIGMGEIISKIVLLSARVRVERYRSERQKSLKGKPQFEHQISTYGSVVSLVHPVLLPVVNYN